MMAYKVIAPLFRANLDDDYRTFVNQGGTSSGKTYTIMQVLFYHAMSENGAIITVCGQDLPNLKVGALRDAKTIINASEWMQQYFKVNESGSFITGINGSVIEFKSYESAQDAKSGKRDYLFINEANGIPYEIYWQLAMRTRKHVFIDYNPSARFWAHDEVMGREGVKLIISDHRGNPFLSQEEHDRIEGITDHELWKVYARGATGQITGLVLTNWDICDTMPAVNERKMTVFGCDFGFTNDPTALEEVALAHGDLYIDERIYSTGMTNPDIVEECKRQGLTRHDLIVADSAEPKSIQELRNGGLWVVGADKGKDSIVVGLDILRRYRLHVTRRSRGLIDNLKSYQWKKDREGRMTNTPEDGNDHGIDAIRYAALAKLGAKRQGTSRATVIRN